MEIWESKEKNALCVFNADQKIFAVPRALIARVRHGERLVEVVVGEGVRVVEAEHVAHLVCDGGLKVVAT